MAYSKAKLKGNGKKARPCFRPFVFFFFYIKVIRLLVYFDFKRTHPMQL
jgi:hypothetical protein